MRTCVITGAASESGLTARRISEHEATLEGLRQVLEKSDAPRAVAVVNMTMTFRNDAELAAAPESGDETAAVARAGRITDKSGLIHATTKRSAPRWIRQMAPTPEWAGIGIVLNAVAPGVVETPMMAAPTGDGGRPPPHRENGPL